MDNTKAEVMVVKGGYRVTVKGQVHWVNKQRQCSCTRTSCAAIRLVADYLRCGGQRAPDSKAPNPPNAFSCPICGAPATGSLEKRNWACSADRRHFWSWRTAQLRAARAEAMKDATPYTREVLTAFVSDQARAEFLSAHALSYAAGI